jgi:Fe-S cluster assembly ATP-binding protein
MPLLQINDLHAAVNGKEILKGVSLTIEEDELHAIMGPNGSGKSTLVNTLMGHPKYEVTKGSVTFRGKDLLAMKPDERARKGLFLAFQYPREIAGVSLRSFLFAAYNARSSTSHPEPTSRRMSPVKFKALLEEKMKELSIDPSFAERAVNEGFSGGEKKKAEILQLKILEPTLALMDETDSGLDIDALKTVAGGINSMRRTPSERPEDQKTRKPFSILLVTHYARILSYMTPNRVHVMVGGKIVESGGDELARKLEEKGYKNYQGTTELPIKIGLSDDR